MMPDQNARFWSKVDRESSPRGCWLWTGTKNRAGYGRFNVRGRPVQSHRFVLILTVGAIPRDKIVCHACNNPSCVNPAHLRIGTLRDNALDSIAIKTWPNYKYPGLFRGTKNGRSKLTEVSALDVVGKYKDVSARSLAKHYGVHSSTIDDVRSGVTWSFATGIERRSGARG